MSDTEAQPGWLHRPSPAVQKLAPLLGLVLFAFVLWVLHHQLKAHPPHEILREIGRIPWPRRLSALLFTAIGYMALTGYDALAVRHVGRRLPYRRTALASFSSYALSHNVGLGLLSGMSVRYRLYSAWGLSPFEVAGVSLFNGVTFWLGILTLTGSVLLVDPAPSVAAVPLPAWLLRSCGGAALLVVAGYLALSFLRRRPFELGRWSIPLPPPRRALSQLALSCLDWFAAGGALYALLPAGSISFPRFVALYAAAQVAGLASQVPGGLGVFEAIILFSLKDSADTVTILGALVAYRGIYYLLPLAIAVALLASHEFLGRREHVRKAARFVGRWVRVLAPGLLATAVFVGGAVLLFSGATPAEPKRLTHLGTLLPLPVIELSHFLGSIAGVGLLLLARGLQRRLDAAWHLTGALLSAGIVLSLLKGLDWEEALLLALMLAALLPSRRYFYRKSSLFAGRFTPPWIAAVALVLLASVWLVLFSHRHLEYSSELWWQFALSHSAPRALRATVGAIAACLVFAAASLLRPARERTVPTAASQLDRAALLAARSPDTMAWLALLGDKKLLFSEDDAGFLMYGVEGRSWVALGDPVGPERVRSELAWRFLETTDRYDAWAVFYQVRASSLPLYLDLGLTLLKLGEEGRVPLDRFSLEGGSRKGLRTIVHKLDKEGYQFEVVPAAGVPALMDEFSRISDTWLGGKSTREKGFSLGRFDPDYLRRFPAAVVRREGRILAFANLWQSEGHEELSPDLMRNDTDAPSGIMDYLFVQMMLWGKEQGYRWFNLGMTPLSGLPDRSLAPLWSRAGAFVYRHGEHFYNFQGLRQYKEKFGPVWQPRYLACPGGLAVPRILANVATLVGGGWRGVVTR